MKQVSPITYALSVVAASILMTSPSSASRSKLSGAEAFRLFHKMVYQLKVDSEQWLHHSRSALRNADSSDAGTACLRNADQNSCSRAINELVPLSILPIREPSIFQLDRDLKTKYKFDNQTGLRVFQLSTALRWIARDDIINGVAAPKRANAKNYALFLKAIRSFHHQKAIEVKKATPMIGRRP